MSQPSHAPTRRRMERTRHGQTTSFQVGDAEFFLTVNTHHDGTPGEVWAKFGKEGSTLAGLTDMVSILFSLCLQYGVPLDMIISKFHGMRFEPFGMTDDRDITQASSFADYLARRLALDYLTPETRIALGITTVDDEARNLAARITHPSKTLPEGVIS